MIIKITPKKIHFFIFFFWIFYIYLQRVNKFLSYSHTTNRL